MDGDAVDEGLGRDCSSDVGFDVGFVRWYVCPIPFALFLEAGFVVRFRVSCQSARFGVVRMIAVQNGGLRVGMADISIRLTISRRIVVIPYAKVSRDAPGVGTCCAVGTGLHG